MLNKTAKSSNVNFLKDDSEIVKLIKFDTGYDAISLTSDIQSLDNPETKFPQGVDTDFNLTGDTKYLLLWFFDWFFTLLSLESSSKSHNSTHASTRYPTLIIDSRTNTKFYTYADYVDFTYETYKIVPDLSHMRTERNILERTSLAVIDPFDISHNIIRKNFDRISRDDLKSLIFEVMTILNS